MPKIKGFITLVCILFFISALFSQTDTLSHGTIKIAKPKLDTVYLKAEVVFNEFQKGHKKNSSLLSPNQGTFNPPKPLFHNLNEEKCDYSNYIRKRIDIKSATLGNKLTDTVRIQLKILDNGKFYCKDLTPLMILNGVPAYYDENKNAYKLDDVHWKCMKIIKNITEWTPAILQTEVKSSYKHNTVIKLKEEKVTATGVLTILFSKIPFN